MKYINWLKNIKGYSSKTIEVYMKYVQQLQEEKLDYERVIKKYEDKSNSTKRIVLSAIKSYYKFMGDARGNDITLPKREIKVQDYVSYEEYRKMLLMINKKTRMGFQRYIIIRLLFETGLRSSELLSIQKNDVVNNRIKINGKGKRQRYVFMSEWLTFDLDEYINSISSNLLFSFQYKNLYSKIKRLSKCKKITPHMFRRGYAKYCFEKEVSIYDISLSMGHSNIDTTSSYINKSSEDVKIWNVF